PPVSSFSFHARPPTALYTLSLHDALPISLDVKDAAVLHIRARADRDPMDVAAQHAVVPHTRFGPEGHVADDPRAGRDEGGRVDLDRKSTRLNSSHVKISYAVFCLKKKKKK